MKLIDEFRNPVILQQLRRRLHSLARQLSQPVRFMEVCGTHTVAMFRQGIRDLLPDNVQVIAGPGCPVCVTAAEDIDKAIACAELPDTIITTFGDMLKVPGSRGSLAAIQRRGADVRMVYSTLDALSIAAAHKNKNIVHIAVGFETTIPTVAAAVQRAADERVANFFLYCAHKVIPPALAALLQSPQSRISGLLLPGHVSAIIGIAPYRFLSRRFGIPAVVAGFEAVDLLAALLGLVQQVVAGQPRVENAYRRVVLPRGNSVARRLIRQVFKPGAASWRGIGVIPDSGLVLRQRFARFDIERHVTLPVPAVKPTPCRCGAVLQGAITPPECPLFGKQCQPLTPVGPCMVSSEGACAAYYRYARR